MADQALGRFRVFIRVASLVGEIPVPQRGCLCAVHLTEYIVPVLIMMLSLSEFRGYRERYREHNVHRSPLTSAPVAGTSTCTSALGAEEVTAWRHAPTGRHRVPYY